MIRPIEVVAVLSMAFVLLLAVLALATPEPHVVDDLFSPHVLNPREHH